MSPAIRRIYFILCWIVFAILILSRVWVAEDAYITFRTVENLYAGHGLVFNPGERVEASTHPLWMLSLVLIRGLGMALHPGSILLGLLCTFAGLAVLFQDGLKESRKSGSSYFIPVAAFILCSISGFRDFATAGMEYGLVFFLSVLLLRSLRTYKISERTFYHAALLGLLYLSRPELGLMFAYYSIFFMIELIFSEMDWSSGLDFAVLWSFLKKGLLWSTGILSTAGVYHLFRAVYYKDIFPNTYYAKSGLSTYYLQGLKYLLVNLSWSPGIFLMIVLIGLALGLSSIRKKLPSSLVIRSIRDLGVIALLILYVVRLGGDFMAFRFLLPEFILLVLVATRFVEPVLLWLRAKPWFPGGAKSAFLISAGLLAFFILLIFWPVPYSKGYIADERRVFTEDIKSLLSLWTGGQTYRWSLSGRNLRTLATCLDLEQLKITNSVTQAFCMEGVGLGYFGVAAGPRIHIIDEQGLPDPQVATSPVLYRWRPGHEHYINLLDVVDRGAAFCNSGEPRYDAIMRTPYGVLIDLRPELIAALPDIQNRLQKLQELKERGSLIIPRLEVRSGYSLAELRRQARNWQQDAYLQSRSSCWQ